MSEDGFMSTHEFMKAHGGDIYGAAEELRRPARSILDFSAPVNPLGPTKKVKAEIRRYLKYLGAYPDPKCRRLIRRIGQLHDISTDKVVCGNGSNELLHMLVSALKPDRVLVTAPSFSEYARAAAGNGAHIESLALEPDYGFMFDVEAFGKMAGSCNMAFISNPNNPTGALATADSILKIVRSAPDCLFVVDEAFIDFAPRESLISSAGKEPNLVVIRSLTKYYGLAGLRIGFAVMNLELKDRLENIRDPWSVNSLAQRASCIAMGDGVFKKQTRQWLETEMPYLQKELENLGFRVFPSSANYILVRHDRAAAARSHLYKRGLLVRDCSNFEGLDESYLRISVRSHKDNSRLIKELNYFLSRKGSG